MYENLFNFIIMFNLLDIFNLFDILKLLCYNNDNDVLLEENNFDYIKDSDISDKDECIICFENSNKLKCGHYIHKECLNNWYKKNKQNNKIKNICIYCHK